MNKTDLIDSVAAKTEIDREIAQFVVQTTFDTIKLMLAQGTDVRLTGFGTFKTSLALERLARNPKTGEPVTIAAHYKPTFVAGKKLKEEVAQRAVKIND